LPVNTSFVTREAHEIIKQMTEFEQLPPPGEQVLNYRIIVFNCSVDNATSRCGVVDAATRLRAGKPKNLVRFPAQARNCSFFQSVRIGCGMYAAFYSVSSEGVFTYEE
jgi:hypothetical protein